MTNAPIREDVMPQATAFEDGDFVRMVKALASAPSAQVIPYSALINSLAGWFPPVPGGRLTLTTGVPVTTADIATSTSVFYTPYIHNAIQLWDGTQWVSRTFAEIELALGTVTASLPYDVFAYDNSGAVALENLAWSNGTTRVTGISIQDGRYCLSGVKTKLYLGTFYTISTTQTEDADVARFLWNMYNRTPRRLWKWDNTGHTYNAAAYRQWNSTAGNKVEFVLGLAGDAIDMNIVGAVTAAAAGAFGVVSLGLDATNAEAIGLCGVKNGGTGIVRGGNAINIMGAAAGYHYIAMIEYGNASNAPTFSDATAIGFVMG